MRKIKDILSVGVVHPLKMMRGDNCIALGTVFFYSHNGKLFLVTAGHNITGKNPETNEILGIPEKIVILLYNIENGLLNGCKFHEVLLTNQNEEPLWLEHPAHGPKIDVMAIPVDLIESESLIAINNIVFDNDLPIEVGMDVFILGYPHGYIPYPHITPIWKRGSLATEFAINIERLPKMYIDTATAKGMSGSPIIAQLMGYFPEGKEDDFGNYVFSKGRCFLGVYTGRYTDEKTANIRTDIFNVQLGIAWKQSIIEEIITGTTNKIV